MKTTYKLLFLSLTISIFNAYGYCATSDTSSTNLIINNETNANKFIDAVERGNFNEYLELIYRGFDVNIKTKHGWTALMRAVSNHNYNSVKMLLDHGADVNLKTNSGNSALHSSVAFYSCFPIVKLLVENGADVNATDECGFTPLMALSEKRFRTQTIKYLLSKGADANIVNIHGKTALDIANEYHAIDAARLLKNTHVIKAIAITEQKKNNRDGSIHSKFVESIEKNDIESVNALIKSGADVDSTNNYRNTPLFHAVKCNNFNIAKLLIDNWADVNCYSTLDSKALNVAITNKNIEMSKLLIENGAIISIEDVINAIKSSDANLLKFICENGASDVIDEHLKYGQNCYLDIAVEINNPEIIKVLATHGFNINYTNAKGLSWLSIACELGYYEIARILIELGARIDHADNYGMTPIIWAAWYGHPDIVKLLIDHGADANSKTVDGTSALMFSSMAGNVETMKILIDHGAKIDAQNNNYISATMEAITSHQTEAVKLLKSKSANIIEAEKELDLIKKCGTNINEKDEFGTTALILAAHENNLRKVKLLVDRGANVCYIVENDGNFRMRQYKNLTALYFAAANSNEAMVKLLIEKGATSDKIDEAYNPLMIIAAERNNFFLVKYLIEKKFDVNEQYKDANRLSCGKTPLIAAMRNIKIMELLIKNGADVNRTVYEDFSGERSPLMIAIATSDRPAIELLVKSGANINYKITKDEILCENGAAISGYWPEKSVECAIQEIRSIKSYSPKFSLSRGNCALREAVEIGDLETIKLLQNSGADINEKNAWGWTYLMLSIRSNNPECVNYFIDINQNINAVSTEGLNWTAIHEAATVCNNAQILDILIKHGANPNQKCCGGWTPLMLAVRSCNHAIVERLIKNGADVNAINDDSMSALDIAENVNYVKPNIVILLKKSRACNNAVAEKIKEVKKNAR